MKSITYYKYSKLAALSRQIEIYETEQIDKFLTDGEILKTDPPSLSRNAYKEIVEMIRRQEIDHVVVHSLDKTSISKFRTLQTIPGYDFTLTIVNFFVDKETSSVTCKEILEYSNQLIKAMCLSMIDAQRYFKLSRNSMKKVYTYDIDAMAPLTIVKLCDGLNINPFRLEDGPIEDLKTKYSVKEVY
jgi:hypothetical protein